MKGVFKSAVVALALCLASGAALADTVTLGTVQVIGTTIDGVRVACVGNSCAGLLESLGGARLGGFSRALGMGDGGGGGGALDVTKDQFCKMLGSQKPSDCNVASPPSVPDYDPDWMPNGCGTGGMEEIFYKMLMSSLFETHFSGSLDAPTKTSNGQNVSFLVACNHHDECWASAGARGTCDDTFFQEMTSACSGQIGSDLNACRGIAEIYAGAVASDAATEHYYDTVELHTCAAWAYDMKRNGCA